MPRSSEPKYGTEPREVTHVSCGNSAVVVCDVVADVDGVVVAEVVVAVVVADVVPLVVAVDLVQLLNPRVWYAIKATFKSCTCESQSLGMRI